MMITNCFCGTVDWQNHQPEPLLEIPTIAKIRHTARRTWTCAEPEFRLSWMKLRSSDNHYTTAPLIYLYPISSVSLSTFSALFSGELLEIFLILLAMLLSIRSPVPSALFLIALFEAGSSCKCISSRVFSMI